jgi:outer membrane protein assembly factor BamB
VLVLPSNLGAGLTWEASGVTGDDGEYQLRGEVVAVGPHSGTLGAFEDCVRVVTQLALSRQGQPLSVTEDDDWYCANVGRVESERRVNGGPVARSLTVATGRHAVPGTLPQLAQTDTPRIEEVDPSIWSLTRVGRTRSSDSLLISTLPPTWIPIDPPLLLGASFESDLIAFDAADPAKRISWRFHVDGSVFGPPTFDAARGQVYFGASDKRLRALDARGLYRWTFEAGDSIASRPAVVGDLVIFGSEDRSIYAVDATNVTLRWSKAVGDAVISSPAVVEVAAGSADLPAQAVLVIGSDDGKVYGLDPRNGDERWTYATGGPVEAPVSAADGVAYVASRSGLVAALDPGSGRPLWTSRVAPDTATLSGPRTAPTISAQQIFVVDENRYVTALSRADGRRLWTSGEAVYVGAPVVLGESVIVATRDGAIHQLDGGGARRADWSIKRLRDPNAGGVEPSFDFGPVLGGAAIWLADDQGSIYRLGPPSVPSSSRPSTSPRLLGLTAGGRGVP